MISFFVKYWSHEYSGKDVILFFTLFCILAKLMLNTCVIYWALEYLKIRQNNYNFKCLIFYSLNVVYFDCYTQGENKTSFQESWKLKRSKIWIFLIPISVFQDFLIPEISLNKSMLLNAFIIRFKKTERNLIWKWFSLFRVTPETTVSKKMKFLKLIKYFWRW
jgi:hypothetical protein